MEFDSLRMPRAIVCGKDEMRSRFWRDPFRWRSQREPRHAGSKSAHEPVPFFLRRAIDNVESLFQLFEQSRDFFRRMLQIVIHCHDHVDFAARMPQSRALCWP